MLQRIGARSGRVHLDVREESAICRVLLDDGIAAEEDAGVVLQQLDLNADLPPPIPNERLGLLTDGIDRCLERDPQRNAPTRSRAPWRSRASGR